MVCETMVCDMCCVQTTHHFNISSDSYYSYVPYLQRENQQESALWHNCRLETDSTQQCDQQEQQQQMMKLSRSRKRKLYVKDHEQPVEQLKRLREEIMASPMMQEMDWQYDSNTIDSNIINGSRTLEQSSINAGCYWVAGNSSLISKQVHNHSDDDELNGNNTEYEKLLFTTHGCSAYHHQRIELFDNRTMTEF